MFCRRLSQQIGPELVLQERWISAKDSRPQTQRVLGLVQYLDLSRALYERRNLKASGEKIKKEDNELLLPDCSSLD